MYNIKLQKLKAINEKTIYNEFKSYIRLRCFKIKVNCKYMKEGKENEKRTKLIISCLVFIIIAGSRSVYKIILLILIQIIIYQVEMSLKEILPVVKMMI